MVTGIQNEAIEPWWGDPGGRLGSCWEPRNRFAGCVSFRIHHGHVKKFFVRIYLPP